MAEQKKMVEAITSMEEDFAKWYTDIVKKAELMDYSSVRGCMIIEPYGWAIWENIRDILDHEFKELGHENVAMPLFIPESLLQKEKDHVEGFAPEVAWVTHGGEEELPERLCVRPTSETLICPSCIISGALWFAGKKPRAPSSAPWSFTGRRVTPCMPPPRRRWKKLSVCSTFTRIFVKSSLLFRW